MHLAEAYAASLSARVLYFFDSSLGGFGEDKAWGEPAS